MADPFATLALPTIPGGNAASDINVAFNWAYLDADHIAYYASGWYPQRAKGVSPDFPVLVAFTMSEQPSVSGSSTTRILE